MNPGQLPLAEIVERSEHLSAPLPGRRHDHQLDRDLLESGDRKRPQPAGRGQRLARRRRPGARRAAHRPRARRRATSASCKRPLRQALALARGGVDLARLGVAARLGGAGRRPRSLAVLHDAETAALAPAAPSCSGCSSSPTSGRRCAAPGRSSIWWWRRPAARRAPRARPRSASKRAPAGGPARASRRRRAARSPPSRSKRLIARAQRLQASEISEAVPETRKRRRCSLPRRPWLCSSWWRARSSPAAASSPVRDRSPIPRSAGRSRRRAAGRRAGRGDGARIPVRLRRRSRSAGASSCTTVSSPVRCSTSSSRRAAVGCRPATASPARMPSRASAMAGGRRGRGRSPAALGGRDPHRVDREPALPARPRACRSAASRGASAGSAPAARSRTPCRRFIWTGKLLDLLAAVDGSRARARCGFRGRSLGRRSRRRCAWPPSAKLTPSREARG